MPFADFVGELLPLDEPAETVLPAAIVLTDGANRLGVPSSIPIVKYLGVFLRVENVVAAGSFVG